MQDYFAILLNLDRDTQRLAHMQAQLAQARIAFTRQPGHLGDALPQDMKPIFFHPDGRPKTLMKRGEVGCYASHLRAMQRVAAGECGPVALIMEDDLDMATDLSAIIDQTLRHLPQGWDIVRLSNQARRAYAPVAQLQSTNGQRFIVQYSKIPTSAGAYLITPGGARKFIENGVRGLTFDDDLRRPWFHKMDTYGILPPPVEPGRAGLSSIDAAEVGRFDKGMSSRMERWRRGDHFHALRRMKYNICNLGLSVWGACVVINCADMIMKPLLGHSIIHAAARLFPVRK